MCCLETSHVPKATFAYPGNLVLSSDWGFWWVLVYFSSIYIVKSMLNPSAVGLLSGVCIPAALGEQTSPKSNPFCITV